MGFPPLPYRSERAAEFWKNARVVPVFWELAKNAITPTRNPSEWDHPPRGRPYVPAAVDGGGQRRRLGDTCSLREAHFQSRRSGLSGIKYRMSK